MSPKIVRSPQCILPKQAFASYEGPWILPKVNLSTEHTYGFKRIQLRLLIHVASLEGRTFEFMRNQWWHNFENPLVQERPGNLPTTIKQAGRSHQDPASTMAIMKYTNLIFKSVKYKCQKRHSNPSGPSGTGNKYSRINSCSSGRGAALLPSEDADSNNDPIPTITFNDDEVALVPSYSATSDPFVDEPDNFPLLDLSSLRSNATALRTAIDTQDQTQTRLATPNNQSHPIRVIIVGGGPNGLVLAHALHQAGIEYILLERSQTILTSDNNDGPGLILWPNSARILDQLGLLRRAHKLACSMRTRQIYHADGTPCPSSYEDVFSRSQSDHGRSCMLISRAALVGLLWEALPGRETHVQTGKEVVSIETHAAGVRVTCADGSVEEGSIVVGCDGVHSVVRQSICDLWAEKKAEGRRRLSLGRLGGRGNGGNGKADKTMEAKYYGLVGSAPLLDGLEPGVCYETRGDATGKTFQVLSGKNTA